MRRCGDGHLRRESTTGIRHRSPLGGLVVLRPQLRSSERPQADHNIGRARDDAKHYQARAVERAIKESTS